jgi:hypothetical protein
MRKTFEITRGNLPLQEKERIIRSECWGWKKPVLFITRCLLLTLLTWSKEKISRRKFGTIKFIEQMREIFDRFIFYGDSNLSGYWNVVGWDVLYIRKVELIYEWGFKILIFLWRYWDLNWIEAKFNYGGRILKNIGW